MLGGDSYNMRQAGFGMIELILTMMLLTITAVSFASSFNFSPSYLKHAEEKIMSDVRYAKNLAMTRGTTFGIYFDSAENRYTVFQGDLANPVLDPSDRSQSLIVDFDTDPNCKGVDLSGASFEMNSILLFDAEGTPRDSFGLPIILDGEIHIANESGAKTLLVSPETGKIRVQ